VFRVYFDRGVWMHSSGNCIFVDSPSWSTVALLFASGRAKGSGTAPTSRTTGFKFRACQGDLDVGAGRGEDAEPFSEVVGPAGTVLAIEAHPVTFG
jgi:hypothetical protein